MKEIYIEKRENYSYPDAEFAFSPSIAYPEYPWDGAISPQKNEAYDMVRCTLIGLGMDKENVGKKEWNPFKDIIKPGDMVLLKPNMVLHENKIPSNGTECLITHPSVVRATLDFVLIALKGEGKVAIGDAPLQSCDFERLISEQGYTKIQDYYAEKRIFIELVDLRLLKSQNKKGLVDVFVNDETNANCTPVNLGNNSHHVEKNNLNRKYRVTNYNPEHMVMHHNDQKHEYLISNYVLNANVIINLPKPKTHRKAGITGGMKNLIGINGNKDWLPHHTKGSLKTGGDEYLNRNIFKATADYLQEYLDRRNTKKKALGMYLIFCVRRGFTLCSKFIKTDPFYEGSWYGNDTIWRTIGDLNKILLYADKNGELHTERQRRLFILGDMIISGEKEGPLLPSPINAGIIVGGDDALLFDTVIATLMGFDWKEIPSITNLYQKTKKTEKFSLSDYSDEEIKVCSNKEEWKDISFDMFRNMQLLRFQPPNGWKGHIEYISQDLRKKQLCEETMS